MRLLYNTHLEDVIDDINSTQSLFRQVIKAAFFNRYVEFVVVFPNGDSVIVEVVDTVCPSDLGECARMKEGTALDMEGNSLDGGNDHGHWQNSDGSGGGGGGFFVRVGFGAPEPGEQWYFCSESGIEGQLEDCIEIPPPNTTS